MKKYKVIVYEDDVPVQELHYCPCCYHDFLRNKEAFHVRFEEYEEYK
jgi:hypothetical protein